MMHLVSDREGKVTKESSLLDVFLQAAYRHTPGRMLLRPLVTPGVSKLGGRFLDSRASCVFIRPFIRLHSIDMTEFEQKKYVSYNDFFTRRISPDRRRLCPEKESFVSPCDGKLSVFKIGSGHCFSVKNTQYTLEGLLRNQKLAHRYAGGYAWVFRLCVEDYHRYIFIDDCRASKNIRIPGAYHTVKPAAFENIAVYKENTREYCLLKTENFGTVLQMEVGALLVGKIENRPVCGEARRGEEKGNFAFGGSTIILLTQKKKVRPAGDILRNSSAGIETKVRLGERVGVKNLIK